LTKEEIQEKSNPEKNSSMSNKELDDQFTYYKSEPGGIKMGTFI
jgi:hypothetical protein